MAFKKQTNQNFQREEAPLSNEEIKNFEKELEPYFKRKCELFNGREITGFDLYTHEKMLFRFSPQYPDGAVIAGNTEQYREAKRKYDALQSLFDRREKVKAEEERRLQTLKI